jgi:hypothetical protein
MRVELSALFDGPALQRRGVEKTGTLQTSGGGSMRVGHADRDPAQHFPLSNYPIRLVAEFVGGVEPGAGGLALVAG